MRQGTRYAIDFGLTRIGLAKSNIEGTLTFPVRTLLNDEKTMPELESEIGADCLEIYVGLPLNLSSGVTQSTMNAVSFAKKLAESLPYPVFLIDERFSSNLAINQLRQIGKSQRSSRGHIDQMAAVAILEYALDMERNTGASPGTSLSQWVEEHE